MNGISRYLLATASILLTSCAHLMLEDCPEGILGKDVPRLRTSRYRVELASLPAAASRFTPYALMSAYAYRNGPTCEIQNDKEKREKLDEIRGYIDGHWKLATGFRFDNQCEDDRGLMANVWAREDAGATVVVIAFRGTTRGWNDWLYGNFWPITTWFNDDDQFKRVEQLWDQVFARFGSKARYLTTGHSLGGGLAQHLLYKHSDRIEQAVVFDPSSITGFVRMKREEQLGGCKCNDTLGFEARMLRVYESYEILSDLRIFHKVFFAPERHVQEVRFPFKSTWSPVGEHDMADFATNLRSAAAGGKPEDLSRPWYASKDALCTPMLEAGQKLSCTVPVRDGDSFVCPR